MMTHAERLQYERMQVKVNGLARVGDAWLEVWARLPDELVVAIVDSVTDDVLLRAACPNYMTRYIEANDNLTQAS